MGGELNLFPMELRQVCTQVHMMDHLLFAQFISLVFFKHFEQVALYLPGDSLSVCVQLGQIIDQTDQLV